MHVLAFDQLMSVLSFSGNLFRFGNVEHDALSSQRKLRRGQHEIVTTRTADGVRVTASECLIRSVNELADGRLRKPLLSAAAQ